MKFKPVLIHACFDQRLGEQRPAECNCRYRISNDEAKDFVAQGRADWVILDWRNGFPVEGANLVWGARPTKEEMEGTVSSAFALKTPRVQTIEKAHIERAYVNGKQEDLDRINAWGELAREVIAELIKPWRDDPFEGRGVFYLIGWDQRSCRGVDVDNSAMLLDRSMDVAYNI